MDQLNSLPYLDCVVRETLRLYAPVPETMRVAEKDDVIPVSEPFVDRFGQVQDNIRWVMWFFDQPRRRLLTRLNRVHRISKGASILIPILALNRSKKYWGEDAHEFKCAPFSPTHYLPYRLVTNLHIAGLSAGSPLPKPLRAFPAFGVTS